MVERHAPLPAPQTRHPVNTATERICDEKQGLDCETPPSVSGVSFRARCATRMLNLAGHAYARTSGFELNQ
jgi:hypothetical protein